MQAGHQAAATAVDSDSDQEDFDQYSELDAFDTEEVEVSPDDEQALAAFMVSGSCTKPFGWVLQSAVTACAALRCTVYAQQRPLNTLSCLPAKSSACSQRGSRRLPRPQTFRKH